MQKFALRVVAPVIAGAVWHNIGNGEVIASSFVDLRGQKTHNEDFFIYYLL